MKQLNAQPCLPSAHVTVNRNRLKNYDDKIYLQNGTEFQIELFNPLSTRVLVKIEIDGMTISSTGLIINPGQRAYLERWIDDDKKFLFRTYDIENSSESKTATFNNGKVKVSFFEEKTKTFINTSSNYTWQVLPFQLYVGTCTTTNNPENYNYKHATRSYYSGSDITGMLSSVSNATFDATFDDNSIKDFIETGRTEMGAKSEQQFDTSFGEFNFWTVSVCEWQILPESIKPVEISKLRQYCPSCKNRIRKETWKFCPACGEEL